MPVPDTASSGGKSSTAGARASQQHKASSGDGPTAAAGPSTGLNTGTTGGTSNSSANTSNSSGNSTSGGSAITIRGLQEVFSSSLVSAASLDYLSISNIIDEDYADTK